MDAISYLTGLAVLLIVGIIGSIIARKLRVSSILLYVLLGVLIANLGLKQFDIFLFPNEFMIALSLLTLAMIVFDGSSRFTLQELDKKSTRAMELVLAFIMMNIILLGPLTMMLVLDWSLRGVLLALVFAVVMAGTDPGSVFVMLGETKHKVLDFLRLEAILNTPIVVIIPFLLLDIIRGVATLSVASTFSDLLVPFLQQVIVGVGTGMLVGILVFRLMRKHYSKQLSPVVVMATVLLTFAVAESLSGNGVIGVATLGLLFGNSYVKRKGQLVEFSTILSTSLEILVFMLLGMLVMIDFTMGFFIKSLVLFGVAVLARYLAILISLRQSEFNMREKVFMAFNMPKGIAVAVVTLTFAVMDVHLNGLLTLMILFVVYSLVLGSVADKFGKFFIKKEIVAEPDETPPVPTNQPAKSKK
ncbi:hypothetical protein GOV07_00185 [Candidatus Woesearchaeota archaeon]|nr:hypothetical protein [Candidatus Woesearchaeota archaeon]